MRYLFALGVPLAFVLLPAALRAAEPPFPAAKLGGGKLWYIENVPVLIVAGSPAEIGEQVSGLGLVPGDDNGEARSAAVISRRRQTDCARLNPQASLCARTPFLAKR